jgi:hypothetical protein
VPSSEIAWSYTSTPPIRLHGRGAQLKKHMDNFTFTLPLQLRLHGVVLNQVQGQVYLYLSNYPCKESAKEAKRNICVQSFTKVLIHFPYSRFRIWSATSKHERCVSVYLRMQEQGKLNDWCRIWKTNNKLYLSRRRGQRRRPRASFWWHTRVYPKVSGLPAWSENCKWYCSLPLGAVVSLFVSQSSEFCRHNPLCCFSTSVYCWSIYYIIDSVRKLLDIPTYNVSEHNKPFVVSKFGLDVAEVIFSGNTS